jgi:exodeoxyribonuclease V
MSLVTALTSLDQNHPIQPTTTTIQKLPLNQGQQAAADGFFEFLFSDQSELIISGPGGVGKTFLMGYLIDQVMPRYHDSCKLLSMDPLYTNVQMTATTNKAASVLGKATGRPTKTIHSFLNLTVKDDYTTGASKLTKTARWTVHQRLILFVDEYSILGWQTRKFLKEGTAQCKIIYVGDHCQLAPVADMMSPNESDHLPFFELTEPMRTDNLHLQAINEQLRETVKTGIFKPIHTVPGVIDLLDGPTMERELKAHFMDPSNQDRILAYTNNRVVQYNDHIRHWRGLPQTLTVGEHVINNSAIAIGGPGKPMMAVEDEFQVTKVNPNIKSIAIQPDVQMDVMYCTLVGVHATFENVPVPVNRDHFNSLMKFYANQKNWKMYFELKNNYPDLRPRDAATTHKAQGSTYDTVFLDLDDLSTCRDKSMAARLLYVAFTRARKRVVMYGTLVSKFGGVIT